ncbi:MAG: PAS domain S-box protein [Alphaproteobacteria bacterium]|nr:PAS domain S-box protein [Alphaproteobacteria bacterium]
MRDRSWSIVAKLVLAGIAVEVVMLTLLLFFNIRTMDRQLAGQLDTRLAEVRQLLDASLAAPLAQRDFATLQDVLDALRRDKGIEYLVLVDHAGREMARSAWPAPTGERYDTEVAITIAGRVYGTLRLGVSTAFFVEARRSLLTTGALIAAIEVLLSTLILSGIGYWLTRRLRAVAGTAEALAAGDLTARVEGATGGDEIDRLGRGFNVMADRLGDRLRDLREAGEALREREDDMRSVLDNLPSMIGYWDRDLRNRFGNHAYATWFGIDPARMAGKHIREIIGEERYRLNMPYIEGALRGEPQLFERAIPAPDGRVRHSLAHYIPDVVDGLVRGFFVLVSDITAVKEAERAVMESNARYDELARCIAVGVYVFRVRADGGMGFDYVSPRFCEMLDVEAEAVLADMDVATAAIHPDDREGLATTSRDAAAKREPIRWEGRGVVRGETRWFRIESSPTALPDGDLRFNAVIIDITDRKGLEEALLRSNADLKQFAYVASHDLRQPLRIVISYVTLLERQLGAAVDMNSGDYIRFVRDGAHRMDRLIHDLLEYSRAGRADKALAPVDLNQVLKDALQDMAVAIEDSGAQLTTPSNAPGVIGCEMDLVRLFNNLIGNAIKYRAADRPPQIAITVEERDGLWRFVVADNGIGIEPDHLDRIFGVFQRLHVQAEYDGTGIGLAVCKRIVERHGGTIHAESEPGQGSQFVFTLPKEGAAT